MNNKCVQKYNLTFQSFILSVKEACFFKVEKYILLNSGCIMAFKTDIR